MVGIFRALNTENCCRQEATAQSKWRISELGHTEVFLVSRRQVTSYEDNFQLMFSRLVLGQQRRNKILSPPQVRCGRTEYGEMGTCFPAIFRMPKKEAFLTHLKTLSVDCFESKTPVNVKNVNRELKFHWILILCLYSQLLSKCFACSCRGHVR